MKAKVNNIRPNNIPDMCAPINVIAKVSSTTEWHSDKNASAHSISRRPIRSPRAASINKPPPYDKPKVIPIIVTDAASPPTPIRRISGDIILTKRRSACVTCITRTNKTIATTTAKIIAQLTASATSHSPQPLAAGRASKYNDAGSCRKSPKVYIAFKIAPSASAPTTRTANIAPIPAPAFCAIFNSTGKACAISITVANTVACAVVNSNCGHIPANISSAAYKFNNNAAAHTTAASPGKPSGDIKGDNIRPAVSTTPNASSNARTATRIGNAMRNSVQKIRAELSATSRANARKLKAAADDSDIGFKKTTVA